MQLTDLRFGIRWASDVSAFVLSTNRGFGFKLLPFHGKAGSAAFLTSCCHSGTFVGNDDGRRSDGEEAVHRCQQCRRPTRSPRSEAIVAPLGESLDIFTEWVSPYFDPLTAVVAGGAIEAKLEEVVAMLRSTADESVGDSYRQVLAIL